MGKSPDVPQLRRGGGTDIELLPDGWDRFEKAVDVAVRSPARGRAAPIAKTKVRVALRGRVHRTRESQMINRDYADHDQIPYTAEFIALGMPNWQNRFARIDAKIENAGLPTPLSDDQLSRQPRLDC
jgi:hypothetical protein